MASRWYALLAVVAAGCAGARDEDRRFAAPDQLVATLTPAGDVELRWRHRATEHGGTWIEVATPGADLVTLGATWPDTTMFTHERVAPETTFLYRVRPFFGHASPIATITTGASGDDAGLVEGPLDEPPRAGEPRSLRAPATAALAAPADLSATLASPTRVDLRWTDRAGDEDGYLVELSIAGRPFEICALLPPDASSFRKTALPPETALSFRVRAFFDGPPSGLASVTTGPDRLARP